MDSNLLLMLVAILGFVAVAGVGFVFAGPDSSSRATKRAQAIARSSKAEKMRRNGQDAANNRRKQILQNLKAVEKQQRKESLTLDARIRQAGLTLTVRNFWIICVGLGVLAVIPGFAISRNAIIALGLGFGTGLGLPRWVLSFLGKRRIKKFTEEFPNSMDVIVRGIKSGLPVHDCLKVIANESPQPLSGEFQRMVESMGMGLSVDQALEKVYERMPTSELRFFTIVIAIQQKTGGNLAEALNNLSQVLRARKLMREKIKAMSGEAVASAFIIGCLPPGIMLLVSLTTPAYMAPMFSDPRGHMMLLGGGVWMGLGIFVMRRMINFKF